MPYIACPRCGVTNFSAGYLLRVERCVRCDAALPQTLIVAPTASGGSTVPQR